MIIRLCRFAFIFITLVSGPMQALAEESKFALAELNGAGYDFSCPCSITNKNGKLIFVSDGEQATANIKIDGKRRTLKWLSSTRKTGAPRLSEIYSDHFADGSLKLKIRYKTTFVCKKGDDQCEVTRYSVDVFLRDGHRKWKMDSLNGECGC